MPLINLKLSKKLYGLNGALDKLDEEFKGFTINPKSTKEFFEIWNMFFYDLRRATHSYFLGMSTRIAYPNGMPPNDRLIEKEDLEKQLRDIQREIDSKEKEHRYFKNNTFIIRNDTGIINTNGSLKEMGPQIGPFYIQSGKKRAIDNVDLFYKLKTKTRKSGADILDNDFLVFVSGETLSGIPDGPPITGTNDIYIDSLEINIYPQTLEQYNNAHIDILLGVDEDELITRD